MTDGESQKAVSAQEAESQKPGDRSLWLSGYWLLPVFGLLSDELCYLNNPEANSGVRLSQEDHSLLTVIC